MNIFKTARADPIELLYQRYASRAYSLSLRLLDDIPAAEKATATAFFTLARLLHQRATPKNVENLLIGITVDHIARQHYGSVSIPRTSRDFGMEEKEETERALDPEALNGPVLEAAIKKLPLDLRFAFVLYEVEKLSHEEIAAMLDWTISRSKSTLARARLELRGSLLETGQARSSPAHRHTGQQKTG